MAEGVVDPPPESTTEGKAPTEEKPEQPPSEEKPEKPPSEEKRDKPPSEEKPETTPKDPKPPSEEKSPQTIFDILKDKWSSIVGNPYRMKVIFCAILFVFALEMARELKHIAIPMFLYKPFRKVSECLKCLLKIMCN